VQGTYEELTGPEAWEARRLLNERLLPVVAGGKTEPGRNLRFSDVHLQGNEHPPAVFFKIVVAHKTGRFERS
jgi:hypothetical protein